MAPGILDDVRLFAGALDLTGLNNKVEITAKTDKKDVTTWAEADTVNGGIWKASKATLAEATIAASGFVTPASIDADRFNALGAGEPWTAFASGNAAVGEVAYLVKMMSTEYKTLDAVGEVWPWDVQLASQWPMARGPGLHPPGTARTADGSGTAVEYLAATSDQYLYASLHVLSISGTSTPTITVKVQSDVDNTFGSPADQITFAAATAVGGQIKRVAGPITDAFYRVTWTITGTSPSFLFVAAAGIK